MHTVERWKNRARRLNTEVHALLLACRHPLVPRRAKLLAALVVAYALSPIDLIPDFIPVLGVLDDLVLLPLGILLAVKMVPEGVWEECRTKAGETASEPGKIRRVMGAVIVIVVWGAIGLALIAGYRNLMPTP